MRKSLAFVAVCLLALPAVAEEKKEPKKVELTGKLRTGIFAIGGETTGIVIETKDGSYELDLGRSKELREKADKLDSKEVTVKGALSVVKGVAVKMRKIVKVDELNEARKK
jgi:hypothetical protein